MRPKPSQSFPSVSATRKTSSLLDIYNVINGFAFEFWMGQKNYQRGPIWNYNAGGGIWAATTAKRPRLPIMARRGAPICTGWASTW